jgi:hypothetical protein
MLYSRSSQEWFKCDRSPNSAQTHRYTSTGETIQTVLDKAIENYPRYIFLLQANEAFAALRQNEALWQEELAERQAWDRTIADGVED